MLVRLPEWNSAGICLKRALFAIAALLLTCCLFAQQGNQYSIGGVVCDSALRRPLPGITISITTTGEATARSIITDSTGRFIFNQVSSGACKLTASGIAYKELQIALAVNNTDVSLDTIFLKGKVTTLQEITLTATKTLIERHIDKLVLNVERSPLAAGGSVMDVLQASPGVSVNDNIISLKGKKGVTIMIDGRPGALSSSDMASVLQSLPASAVSRIEIITNPSAQYDAAGNGGIINIVTKRSRAKGVSGAVNASSGFGVYPKYNGGGNLNYKEDHVNFFGNYYTSHSTRFNTYSSKRLIDSLTFNESGRSKTNRTAHNYLVGIDWQPGKRNVIGFSMTGNIAGSRDKEDFNTDFTRVEKDSSLLVANVTNEDYNTNSWNLNHELQLDTLGKTLKTNIDYSRFLWHNNGDYNNTYYNQTGLPLRDVEMLRNNSRVLIKIGSVKIDYTQPVKSKDIIISAGIKTSWVRTDSDIQFYQKNSFGWKLDEGKTNHFIFDEFITAGYVNVNKKLKDYEFQLGLRAEHTYNKGNLLTGNVMNRNDYLKFFPTVFVSKELGSSQTINISYGKRINRPSYEDLNPFIYYNSPYSFYQGNSFLRPELSNNFEIEYSLNDEWIFSLSYSNTKDYFTYLTYLDEITRVSKETINNFRRYISYGTSISLDKDITKWWHLSASIDAYHEAFNAFYRTRDFKNSIISVNSDLTSNFTLGKNNSFVLTGIYRSPTFDGIKKLNARYRVDAGYEKGWLNKNLVLKLAVRDIFYTYRNNGINRLENLNSEFFNRGDSRVLSIDLTYKFGNQKLKSHKPKQGNNDELNRIKGLD